MTSAHRRKFQKLNDYLPFSPSQLSLILPPDRRASYSNLGYAVLGNVLADILSTPWADAVQEYILDPLKMTSTGFFKVILQTYLSHVFNLLGVFIDGAPRQRLGMHSLPYNSMGVPNNEAPA